MRALKSLLVLAVVAAFGIFCMTPPAHAVIRATPTPMQVDLPVVKVTITGHSHKPEVFNLELAVTGEEQEIGLMGRTHLADNAGMLFLFQKPGLTSFWMADTLIPLDMLFIDVHGRIFHIKENAKPNDLTPIPSEGPVKAVIEMKGGGIKAHGIRIGDMVQYKAFK